MVYSFLEIINLMFTILSEFCISIYDFFVQFLNPKYKSLKNEVVLITGAGCGIGRLLCLKFAEQNSVVIAVDIDQDGLVATKDLVASLTGKNITIALCDIRSKSNITTLRKDLQKLDLHVNILVNNAGIAHGKRILELSEEEISETFQVNVMSNFYTVQEFLPLMLLNDHGHVVFISSIAATTTSARTSDYCASKAGNYMLAESLMCELAHVYRTNAIKVTLVTPFFIKTDLFNGCKSKFPLLLPDLEPNYVADKIVKGVMKNQKHLAIGRLMYLIPIMKALFPVNAILAISKFAGGMQFLDKFKNIKNENRKKFYENLQQKNVKVI